MRWELRKVQELRIILPTFNLVLGYYVGCISSINTPNGFICKKNLQVLEFSNKGSLWHFVKHLVYIISITLLPNPLSFLGAFAALNIFRCQISCVFTHSVWCTNFAKGLLGYEDDIVKPSVARLVSFRL